MRYLLLGLLLLPVTLTAQTPLFPEMLKPATQQTEEAVAQTLQDDLKIKDKASQASPTEVLPKQTEGVEKKVLDKKFYALMIGLQVSTVMDMESTYHALNNCPRGYVCHEGNPAIRPLVKAGRPTVYAVTAGTNFLAGLSSYYLKKKKSRYWWVPVTIVMGVHTFAAVKNYQIPNR